MVISDRQISEFLDELASKGLSYDNMKKIMAAHGFETITRTAAVLVNPYVVYLPVVLRE